MDGVKDGSKTLANYWVLEYCCKRLCQIFLEYDPKQSAIDRIESWHAIIREIISSIPTSSNIDELQKSWILLSELCIRLLKKNFEFSEADNFKSMTDLIKHICDQFNVSPKLNHNLARYFNSQNILICLKAGLVEEAKDIFNNCLEKKLLCFAEHVKDIIHNCEVAEDAEIPVHLQYNTFLSLMKKLVDFVMKKIDPGVLEQVVCSYNSIEEESSLDQSELLALFRYHMQQKNKNEGKSGNAEAEIDVNPDQNMLLRRNQMYRKLFNHNQTALYGGNFTSVEGESTRTGKQCNKTRLQKSVRQRPESSHEDHRPTSMKGKRNVNCTATRPDDPDPEELPNEAPKMAEAAPEQIVENSGNACVAPAADGVVDDAAADADVSADEESDLGADESVQDSIQNIQERPASQLTSSPIRSATQEGTNRLSSPSMSPVQPTSASRAVDRSLSHVSSQWNTTRGARTIRVPSAGQNAVNAGDVRSRHPVMLLSIPQAEHRNQGQSTDRQDPILCPVGISASAEINNISDMAPRVRASRIDVSSVRYADSPSSIRPNMRERRSRQNQPGAAEHSDASTLSSNDEAQSIVSTTDIGSARKRKPFTNEEEAWLRRGVNRYGVGKWSKILKRYPFKGRTSVNLKDKWRNIMRKESADE